jgi:hypothetical protein
MNTPLPFRGRCLTSGMLACVVVCGTALAIESATPRGTLGVDRNFVRTGTHSQLNWKIEYPSSVVEVDTPNVIKPKKELKMRVRLLGATFKTNKGHGNNVDGVDADNVGGKNTGAIDYTYLDDEISYLGASYLPVEVVWSLNGADWTQIFYGYQGLVKPSTVILEATVKEGDAVNFGGRGWRDEAWLPLYSTAQSSPNVIVLKDGEEVPSSVPALLSGNFEKVLKPYMDPTKRTVKIGERDLIILMELGESDPKQTGFDLQDAVLLVTFE